MFKNDIKISVVVPTYNSSEWILEMLEMILAFLDETFLNYDLIVVNDCSADDTLEKLGQIVHPNLQLINLQKRSGQHSATWQGINRATGDIVVTMDDDGEFPANQISVLLEKFEKTKTDLTYGIPSKFRKKGIHFYLYKIYLKLLEWNGEERKSSFRLISRSFLNQVDLGATSILNLDIYLETYSPKYTYVMVDYVLSERGRYGLRGHFSFYFKTIFYKFILSRKS